MEAPPLFNPRIPLGFSWHSFFPLPALPPPYQAPGKGPNRHHPRLPVFGRRSARHWSWPRLGRPPGGRDRSWPPGGTSMTIQPYS